MRRCKKDLLGILAENKFQPIPVEEGRVYLVERNSEGRIIMSVMVYEISENSIVIKCPGLGRSFQGKRGRICDFLLLNWVNEREVEVFFFELKTTYNDTNVEDAKEQIQSTKSWLQQYVVPKIKEQSPWCRDRKLNAIQEHHVILFEGGKRETKPTRFLQKYHAEGESGSLWACSKYMLDGICCKMNAVSLKQIRYEAKA